MNEFKISALFLLGFIAALAAIGFAEDKDLQEVKEIKEDIQIINLLNNLDLQKKQTEFIITKAQEMQALRAVSRAKIEVYEIQMLKTFGSIKQEVASGRVTVEKEDKGSYSKLKHEVEKISQELEAKSDTLAGEIEGQLQQYQLMALDNYKTCIVPIMSKGRIGQADADVGITKMLEEVKAAPEPKYSRLKERLIQRLLGKAKEKAKPGATLDETKIRADIIEAFEGARIMDDVDFQLQKSSIAEELSNKILPKKAAPSRKDKIKRFLLSENIIPILNERLAGKEQEEAQGAAAP